MRWEFSVVMKWSLEIHKGLAPVISGKCGRNSYWDEIRDTLRRHGCTHAYCSHSYLQHTGVHTHPGRHTQEHKYTSYLHTDIMTMALCTLGQCGNYNGCKKEFLDKFPPSIFLLIPTSASLKCGSPSANNKMRNSDKKICWHHFCILICYRHCIAYFLPI